MKDRQKMIHKIFGTMVLVALAQTGLAASFGTPEKLTNDSAKFQMSRNANSTMAFDSADNLHVAYWSGTAQTRPETPSYVIYQSRSSFGTWATAESIDDSTDGTDHLGGRHPSLAVRPDDSVAIAWHDHRDSTLAGNYIDNVEIYGDLKPFGGVFSSTDNRITNATGNGYVPRMVSRPDGSLAVMWNDFHDEQNISDIYVRVSDTSGVFDSSPSILTGRITNQNDRSGVPSYSIGDLTVDGSGNLFAVWSAEFEDPDSIFFSEISIPAAIVTETEVSSKSGTYFDPPKIAITSTGDVWVAYTYQENPLKKDVYLQKRAAGQSTFESPIAVAANTNVNEYGVNLAVDSQDNLNLVWVDERAGQHVYYGLFNTTTEVLDEEVQLTTASGEWERPAIALNSDDVPSILVEENVNTTAGAIWSIGPPPLSTGPVWESYQ